MPGEKRSSLPRSNRNLQLGFPVKILLLPRNWSVTNVNMWQPLRRGSDSTFRWNTRSHQRFSGAWKSQEGLLSAPLLCSPTPGRNYATIVKLPSPLDIAVRFTDVINVERFLVIMMTWVSMKQLTTNMCAIIINVVWVERNSSIMATWLNMKQLSTTIDAIYATIHLVVRVVDYSQSDL